MGYDITRFQGEVDPEFICPVCSGVLENPWQVPTCEHIFCKPCIDEWLSTQFYCPVDREPVSANELKPAPRILRNLLSRLMIMCGYASLGCPEVVKLELLEIHQQACEHNPNRPVLCEQGCGLIVPKDQFKDHNCIREVRLMLKSQQLVLCDIHCGIDGLKREIDLLKICIQNFRPSPVLESSEEDGITRWANSLPRARVNHWGAMISNPEPLLKAMVRRALDESGCPAHLTVDLMDNAHEGRWPSGLCTLGTRQTNRSYFGNYVCKRIPEKQAIVVLAVDNRHMNDDMVLEPGIVMIFAHGIE